MRAASTIWEPDATGAPLQRSFGFCESNALLGPLAPSALAGEEDKLLLHAFNRGVPAIAEPIIAIPSRPKDASPPSWACIRLTLFIRANM